MTSKLVLFFYFAFMLWIIITSAATDVYVVVLHHLNIHQIIYMLVTFIIVPSLLGTLYIITREQVYNGPLWCIGIPAVLSFSTVIPIGVWFVFDWGSKQDPVIFGPAVTLGAAVLAALGVTATVVNAHHLHRRQHTMGTLLRVRESQLLDQHFLKVFQKFPTGPIGKEEFEQLLNDSQKRENFVTEGEPSWPTLFSILYILNFYEYIALSVRTKDMDQKIIKGALRGIIKRMFDMNHVVIDHFAQKNNRSYEHLRWLIQEWDTKAP